MSSVANNYSDQKKSEKLIGEIISIRKLLVVAYATIITALGSFTLWAVFWPLAEGSHVQGKLDYTATAIDLNHEDGGRVASILANVGSYVRAGDILLTFDVSDLQSQLDITTSRLDRLAGEELRRKAEADLAENMIISPEVEISDRTIEQELARFEEQRLSFTQQVQIQQSRIKQLSDSIAGTQDQIKSTKQAIKSIKDELTKFSELLADGFISEERVIALERQQITLNGELAAMHASSAAQTERQEEIRYDIIRLEQQYKQQAIERLAAISAEIDELSTQNSRIRRRIDAAQIKAPMDGWVDDLMVAVPGESIGPGANVAKFVPGSGDYKVLGRLSPTDVDTVKVGQEAVVEFPTFSTRNPPRLDGLLEQISAGVFQDPRTGESYYRVTISLKPDQPLLTEIKGDLRVGLPVQVLIQSGERSFFEYLLSPFKEMMRGAFHE